MDLNKLLKKKEKAVDENNQLVIAETCEQLGSHFINRSKLQEALNEFHQMANIYQSLDRKMDFGRANRMIGEVYLLMGKYQDALMHEDIYLKKAKQMDDLVEIQRAYASIGRCFLFQAEDKSERRELGRERNSNDEPNDFKAAEKAFLKSLIICKELKTLVSRYELADMQARLYLNLGVTKEHIQELNEAIGYYETAIKICKSNDLFELRHQCLMAIGLAYAAKDDDSSRALNSFNTALEVAKRIHDNNEKTCETLLAKSSLLVKNGDFQSARQVLKKAYKLKTPNQNDKELIQKKLKYVLVLTKCEDELVTTNAYDYSKRKVLFEKLGDGSCKLKNYPKAIEFYLKSLEAAHLNGDGELSLIPIYVSLYQTYIDNKEYEPALDFMKKEYELVINKPKEACATLMAMGNLLDQAGKPFWEVDTIYRKALVEAKKADESTLEKSALLKLVRLSRKHHMVTVAEILEKEAVDRGIQLMLESSEDIEYSEDIPDIDDDISSSELQLSSDPESSENEQKSIPNTTKGFARKKRPAVTVKKNIKGETRLHEACINGNYELVRVLVEKGHAINVRDNAGWLPLHEAAIHGFRDIAELLLDSGGQSAINDKGGTSCEGITPLYDAASNGNLSVVQLLLDRGAKANLKTDFNETPLDALLRWHDQYGHKLAPNEQGYYDDIKGRLKEQCEKIGMDTSTKPNTSSSGYDTNRSRSSQPKSQQNMRFNLSFSDESENGEPESRREEERIAKSNAQVEYKNVMKSLKNRNKDQRSLHNESGENKKRSAYLTAFEVDPDEWLEDDLGPSKKKPKVHCENPDVSPQNVTPKKRLSRNSSSFVFDSDSDIEVNDENVGLDAFDAVMNAGNPCKMKPKRRNSSSKQHKTASSQPSLLDTDFSRYVEVEEQNEHSNINTSLYGVHAENQLIIKVQVGDEKIIVPMNKGAVISQLVDEAARRYYCLKGIRPELRLKTADGATLIETDPIALIMSLNEENFIHSDIIDWKLPSLQNRYLEACSELKCSVFQEISEFLEMNRSTVNLDLSNQSLCPSVARSVLKALHHQNCLTELDLSNNCIQDEGVKLLSQTLITLKQLQLIDLSGNMVTEVGIEYLCNVLCKSREISQLTHFKINFNPIKSTSLKSISCLCRKNNIVSLSLSSCELTDTSKLELLSSVKFLDISYNHLTKDGFDGFLRNLNPSVIETLNLERCSSEAGLGDSLVKFINSGGCSSLQEVNLTGIYFNENEILDLLRNLEKCEHLKLLDLSNQKELTFLTLKYLLFTMECQSLQNVKLIGCKSLYNIANMFNLQNLDMHQASRLQNVQLSLPKGSREEFVERMKELWDVASKHCGKIDLERNTLFFVNSVDENEVSFNL